MCIRDRYRPVVILVYSEKACNSNFISLSSRTFTESIENALVQKAYKFNIGCELAARLNFFTSKRISLLPVASEFYYLFFYSCSLCAVFNS